MDEGAWEDWVFPCAGGAEAESVSAEGAAGVADKRKTVPGRRYNAARPFSARKVRTLTPQREAILGSVSPRRTT